MGNTPELELTQPKKLSQIMKQPRRIELGGESHVPTYDKFESPTWWHAGSLVMAATIQSRRSEEPYPLHVSINIPVPNLFRQHLGALLARQGESYDPDVTEHICVSREELTYADPTGTEHPYAPRLASA